MDITYAVQRLGEEKAIPRMAPHQLGPLGEAIDEEVEEEEEDEDDNDESESSKIPASSAATGERLAMAEQLVHGGRGVASTAFKTSTQAGRENDILTLPETPLTSRRSREFELNITNATLLRNRRDPVAQG